MTEPVEAAARGTVLSLSRVLKASREAVYRAFTDPLQLGRWYGPRGFTVTIDHFEARRGGSYRLCMVAPDGSGHWLRGSFLALEPPERLAFT